MAVSIPPLLSIAATIGRITGRSSHALNPRFDGNFGWQAEYGLVSFSEHHLPRVVTYVEDQPQHHPSGSLWPALEQLRDPNDDDPAVG